MSRPLPPAVDRGHSSTLAEQIAAFYRAAIEQGQLRAGDRLPPIREVSEAVSVTRGTVQDAYHQLGDQGLVESTVGRGTTVTARAETPTGGPLSAFAEAALHETRDMPQAPAVAAGTELVADLAELAPDTGRFPVDAMRAAMDRVLQQRGKELLGYGHEAQGLPELREMLSERSRGIDRLASADEILITAGAQQGLDLVLRTFCQPGDAVIVTTPSYHQMAGLLKAHGLQVLPVAFGPNGLDLEELQRALTRPSVRLLYLMPSFHNPTGCTLDLEGRLSLLEIMSRTEVPILEDEYQQPLRFRGDELPSLRILDKRGLTVTVQTFSKGLFPGLRVGWVHGGPRVLEPMAAVKRFMDLETSPLLQAAIVEFVRKGAMDRYLKSLGKELARRHGAVQKALVGSLPDGCTITDPDGGFVTWLELPADSAGASTNGPGGPGDRLAELAALRGVRVVPGRVFDALGRPSRGVRLSLSRADVHQIERGCAVLCELAHDLTSPRPLAPAKHFL